MAYQIYCLYNKKDNTIFYIGVTNLELSQRLRLHFQEAKKGKPFNALKSYLFKLIGNNIGIKLIESTSKGKKHAYAREIYYIKLYYKAGNPLCNGFGVREGLKQIIELKNVQNDIISSISMS